MCGLVGAAGNLVKREVDVFNTLLLWDVVRGPHSTGVGVIKKDGGRALLKRAMPSYDLQGLKSYDKTLENPRVIIGHNRWATQGAHSHRNAHPFEFDNVMGVHNGTIGWQEKKVLTHHAEYETDSEALFRDINDLGIDEVIPKVDGAYSLVWWDEEKKRLCFLRNKERPMFYAITASEQEMFWASEAYMLHGAMTRAGINYNGKVFSTREDIYYEFDVNDKGKVVRAGEREVKGKPKTPFVMGGQQGWHGDQWWDAESYVAVNKSAGTPTSVARLPSQITETPAMRELAEARRQTAERLAAERTVLGLPNKVTETTGSPGKTNDTTSKPSVETKRSGSGGVSVPSTPSSTTSPKVTSIRDIRNTPKFVRGFGSTVINKEDFDKTTNCECVYCQKSVTFKEVAEKNQQITWLSRDRFLCEDCGDDENITDYIGGINKRTVN